MPTPHHLIMNGRQYAFTIPDEVEGWKITEAMPAVVVLSSQHPVPIAELQTATWLYKMHLDLYSEHGRLELRMEADSWADLPTAQPALPPPVLPPSPTRRLLRWPWS